MGCAITLATGKHWEHQITLPAGSPAIPVLRASGWQVIRDERIQEIFVTKRRAAQSKRRALNAVASKVCADSRFTRMFYEHTGVYPAALPRRKVRRFVKRILKEEGAFK